MTRKLAPSPTPENFADAVVRHQIRPAVARLAGDDERLSRPEARQAPVLQSSRSPQLRAAVDNIERYSHGSHKDKPMASTVVEHVRADAERAARKAAGPDGRLSGADAAQGLPAHLYDNYVALRDGTAAPARQPARPQRPATPGSKPANKPTPVTPLKPAVTFDKVSMAQITKAAALLKAILQKTDNGDLTLTVREATHAFTNVIADSTWTPDGTTYNAIIAAVNKQKSRADRSLTGILAGIDVTIAELAAQFGGAAIDGAMLKKVKTNLGANLVTFAAAHHDKKVKDFEFAPEQATTYVPSRPFRAPNTDAAAPWVQALVDHFNSYANDNSKHGPRPMSITRFVLGPVETQSIAEEIARLPAALAKRVLKELSRRITQADNLAGELSERRVWVEPAAEATFGALAKKVGLKVTFKGNPVAPRFDYY